MKILDWIEEETVKKIVDIVYEVLPSIIPFIVSFGVKKVNNLSWFIFWQMLIALGISLAVWIWFYKKKENRILDDYKVLTKSENWKIAYAEKWLLDIFIEKNIKDFIRNEDFRLLINEDVKFIEENYDPDPDVWDMIYSTQRDFEEPGFDNQVIDNLIARRFVTEINDGLLSINSKIYNYVIRTREKDEKERNKAKERRLKRDAEYFKKQKEHKNKISLKQRIISFLQNKIKTKKGAKTMITFNKPFIIENELKYIKDAVENQKAIRGDGAYTKKCHAFLEQKLNCKKALLTHSCTAALEMAAILLDMKPGDEVIMPSYTFVSTANAFVLRGAVPVFVDIRPDTQNINEDLIEDAITPKTKAICCVHYAGVACDMDKILDIAKRHNLYVVEDAAQALGSTYKGKPLGTIGDLGCFSFHETKNIISGEGGAIIINNEKFIERAEIIREKGTNRSKFFRGQVDKYTWVDIGSSFLPSDMIAAFLYSQLENMDKINEQRMHIWNYYDKFFKNYDGIIKRPVCPKDCKHNAHMYYIMFKDLEKRTKFIDFMKENGIVPAFHYIPLHSSPAGKKYCRVHGSMTETDNTSETLVRLPMFYELDDKNIDYILEKSKEFFKEME